jgi:hypothetical protein
MSLWLYIFYRCILNCTACWCRSSLSRIEQLVLNMPLMAVCKKEQHTVIIRRVGLGEGG